MTTGMRVPMLQPALQLFKENARHTFGGDEWTDKMWWTHPLDSELALNSQLRHQWALKMPHWIEKQDCVTHFQELLLEMFTSPGQPVQRDLEGGAAELLGADNFDLEFKSWSWMVPTAVQHCSMHLVTPNEH